MKWPERERSSCSVVLLENSTRKWNRSTHLECLVGFCQLYPSQTQQSPTPEVPYYRLRYHQALAFFGLSRTASFPLSNSPRQSSEPATYPNNEPLFDPIRAPRGRFDPWANEIGHATVSPLRKRREACVTCCTGTARGPQLLSNNTRNTYRQHWPTSGVLSAYPSADLETARRLKGPKAGPVEAAATKAAATRHTTHRSSRNEQDKARLIVLDGSVSGERKGIWVLFSRPMPAGQTQQELLAQDGKV